MGEQQPRREEEARKEAWLRELAEFIVIANRKTWASDGGEVLPRRPGFKRHQWPYPKGRMTPVDMKDYLGWENWRYEDEYSGYFRGPGTSTIYYKDKAAWVMSYGGRGLIEGHEDGVKETFEFLKAALKQVTAKLPFRGPRVYVEGSRRYEFDIDGTLDLGRWNERITEEGIQTFGQTGQTDLAVGRDSNRQPVYPWNL